MFILFLSVVVVAAVVKHTSKTNAIVTQNKSYYHFNLQLEN